MSSALKFLIDMNLSWVYALLALLKLAFLFVSLL